MTDVRRHRHHLGEAAADELGVDHRVGDPDIGEQPAVAVPRLRVELQTHLAAAHELAVHRGGGAPARLLALPRMMDLGRVDADVADLLDTPAHVDMNRVAVDNTRDGALERRLAGGGKSEAEQQQ